MLYGHWTLAYRSGGYNLRNTALDTINFGPGPFDEEKVSNFEVGYKGSLLDNLVAIASVGYTDASYSDVKFDLKGDGVIDGKDEDLDLPRAAEWTYSLSLNLDTELGDRGYITSRVSYAYRDDSAFTDSNLGTLNSLDMVEAGIDYHSANDHWTVSLYGRNLLDETSLGGDTQLPAMLGPVPLGGTFSPLPRAAQSAWKSLTQCNWGLLGEEIQLNPRTWSKPT